MATVHILPEEVINKIAAGEVVERPASALKELVDNAIDAGATSVQIDLKEGGISYLSVKDNGSGMSAKDAELSLKRHATSKISKSDDLFHIESKGFRGEALSSISAVSHFTLQTKQAQGADEGTRVFTKGGEAFESHNWSGDQGTQIVIEDLFFNVPARRRFLKNPSTEFAYCHELIQAYCLAHPEVGFTLRHNEKEYLSSPATKVNGGDYRGESALRSKAKDFLKDEIVDKLLYTTHETQYGRVELLLSPPGVEKATTKNIYMFVNNRWVKDKTVRMGVMRGYHSHMMKGKFPVCIVHLNVDPTLVDVNVHPAKTELRFQYASEIQSLIAIAIKDVIRSGDWAMPEQTSFSSLFSQPDRSSMVGSFNGGGFSRPSAPPSYSQSEVSVPSAHEMREVAQTEAGTVDNTDVENSLSHFETKSSQLEIDWSELKFCGAYAKCFLFFEEKGGLLVVDQHAFHERILYEKLSKDRSLIKSSQALLVPEEVILNPTQLEWLKDNKEKLHNSGFVYNILDEKSVEVSAIPALVSHRSVEELMDQLSSQQSERNQEDTPEAIMHLLVATIACHSAVRAGEELGDNELKQLLREATDVDFYHNCPHGRPVFKWFKHSQVEHWFERV